MGRKERFCTKHPRRGVFPEQLDDTSAMNQGDPHWRACFEQLAPKLLLFARQWVTSAADAEDVVQNAFVRFWRHQPDAAPEHYPLLYAAVRTSALDWLRAQCRRRQREADERVPLREGDEPFFDTTIQQRELAESLEAALERLPAAQREVLVLHIWSELTFAQIATVLGESANTVASRYRYGLAALRRIVKPTLYERV
jgi:RNA polymerase sigma-70 factor (ECF subfamily)